MDIGSKLSVCRRSCGALRLVALVVVAGVVCCVAGCSGQGSGGVGGRSGAVRIDSLLAMLDSTIARRPAIQEARDVMIDSLRREAARAEGDSSRFEALGHLLDAYHSYNTDSSFAIGEARMKLALRTGRRDFIDNARLNMVEELSSTGLYKEASELYDSVDAQALVAYLKPFYYHVGRTLYGRMHDYAILGSDRRRYDVMTDRYRDSVLALNPSGGVIHTLVSADRYNARGKPDKAIETVSLWRRLNPGDDGYEAVLAYTLAESYRLRGDRRRRKEQLIVSANADLASGCREYVALRELSMVLFEEGDVDRAHAFLAICLDDARRSNARMRTVEVNEIFPYVNDSYLDAIRRQESKQRAYLWVISLLGVGLLIGLVFIAMQVRRVARARRQVEDANGRLRELNGRQQELNAELRSTVIRLREANARAAEASGVKVTYIGRYMDLCLVYIEKLDSYRKGLSKLLLAGKTRELESRLKSDSDIARELKYFYENFDAAFLQLFPTFVEDFNALLQPEARLEPKAPGRLSPELRIFALVRLGITESGRIAQFLRYSPTTVYNYRTRVRNKALGDRDMLEERLMGIGAQITD